MPILNKKTGDRGEAFYSKGEERPIKVMLENGEAIYSYKMISELFKYWEYFNIPAKVEPLIEGRSQRAVLRAAASLAGVTTAIVERSEFNGIVVFNFGDKCRVELKDSGINIKNSGIYTITELCGEEE